MSFCFFQSPSLSLLFLHELFISRLAFWLIAHCQSHYIWPVNHFFFSVAYDIFKKAFYKLDRVNLSECERPPMDVLKTHPREFLDAWGISVFVWPMRVAFAAVKFQLSAYSVPIVFLIAFPTVGASEGLYFSIPPALLTLSVSSPLPHPCQFPTVSATAGFQLSSLGLLQKDTCVFWHGSFHPGSGRGGFDRYTLTHSRTNTL